MPAMINILLFALGLSIMVPLQAQIGVPRQPSLGLKPTPSRSRIPQRPQINYKVVEPVILYPPPPPPPPPVITSDWSVRLGMISVTPNVVSGDLSAPSFPKTQIKIGSNTQLGGGINYRYNDHLAFDVPLAPAFTHKISGAGAIDGVGLLAEIKVLPLTAIAQWRFRPPTNSFRPYVGAGLTYASFFDSKSNAALSAITGGTPSQPTTLKVESQLAPTVQVGATITLNPYWYLDTSYSYTELTTTATLSTGQTIKVALNPATFSFALGYRFE